MPAWLVRRAAARTPKPDLFPARSWSAHVVGLFQKSPSLAVRASAAPQLSALKRLFQICLSLAGVGISTGPKRPSIRNPKFHPQVWWSAQYIALQDSRRPELGRMAVAGLVLLVASCGTDPEPRDALRRPGQGARVAIRVPTSLAHAGRTIPALYAPLSRPARRSPVLPSAQNRP